MVDPTHARLSIDAVPLGLGRTLVVLCYEGTGESPLNLRLMRVIDEQRRFWRRRSTAARQMTRWLRRQGDTVSRKRVRRLTCASTAGGARDRTTRHPTAQGRSQAHPAHRLSLPVTRSA